FFAPTPFNVTNPVYTNPPVATLLNADFPVFRQQRTGGYLQDLIDITPNLKGLAGARFDTLDFTFDRTVPDQIGVPTHQRVEQTFNHVSPRAGLVYQPFADESLAYYYSYSQSFTPPGGGIYLNPATNILPIIGESHEAGVKTLLLDNLSLTA